jgi:IMP dehydrogenase
MKFQRCLSYDDVLLAPQYSEIRSRSEVNIGNSLDDERSFMLPVISAPMDTITESTMAIAMGMAGGLGVIHRYNSIEDQAAQAFQAREFGIKKVAAAIGITGDFLDRAEMLITMGTSILCLDVAHGHHAMMKEAITKIKDRFPYVHIMAGNIATKQAFEDLASWGADSIRIGIGGGSICSTRIQTGHGIPTLQSVLDCASSNASKGC